jgi:hypothetical protein
MTQKIAPPAQLDNTKIHTRDEYRQWQAANFEYHAYLREQEQAAERQQAADLLESQREMTDNEYFVMAVEREKQRQKREAEREAERQQAAAEKAAYLASLPDVAVISESNPYCFVQEIMHWTKQGYSLAPNAEVDILFGLHRVCLDKPAPAKKAAK